MDKNQTVGNRKIASLFDAGSFVEVGAYIKRSGDSGQKKNEQNLV